MNDRIYRALLGGGSSEQVQPSIERLSAEEHEVLLRQLGDIRDELHSICADHAEEVERVLTANRP